MKEFVPLWDEVGLDAVHRPGQCDATEEENDEDKIRECRREVNHLQMETAVSTTHDVTRTILHSLIMPVIQGTNFHKYTNFISKLFADGATSTQPVTIFEENKT